MPMSEIILEIGMVNSVRNPPSFFATFFEGNILELGIGKFVRIPSSFFATFFVGYIFELGIVFFYLFKYFGTRNGEFP